MAVIWSQVIEGNHYEVRTAGETMRLYRNGIHHSQYNPNRPLGGGIWDLLSLPALYRPKGKIKDALILGFGAGSAGRVLQQLVEPKNILGVELDPIHLTIADGFFDCSHGCELLSADAVQWVRHGAGKKQYDYILDDLYAEDAGLPVRCAPMDLAWYQSLAKLLRPNGLLVLNILEPDKLPYLAPLQDSSLRHQFTNAEVFKIAGYENRILALSAVPFDTAQLTSNLCDIFKRFPRCRGVTKIYQSESLIRS